MYLRIVNGEIYNYPYFLENLRKDFPRISFPKDEFLTDQLLAIYGVYPVQNTEPPIANNLTHSIIEELPISKDGAYFQSWSVQEKSVIHATEAVKKQRNDLLKSSDWTQVADAPVNRDAWATYRQELRNIPTQDGFPFNLTWPTPPV